MSMHCRIGSNSYVVHVVCVANNIESEMAGTTPNNAPSKTGNPSGGGRGNNPPAKGK